MAAKNEKDLRQVSGLEKRLRQAEETQTSLKDIIYQRW